jgi:hypothetical protein
MMDRAELLRLASPPCHECREAVRRVETRWHLDADAVCRPSAFMVCADGHRVAVEPLF